MIKFSHFYVLPSKNGLKLDLCDSVYKYIEAKILFDLSKKYNDSP